MFCVSHDGTSGGTGTVKATLHDRGQRLSARGDLTRLVALLRASLETCDGVYEQVVTEEMMEDLKRLERCLEVALEGGLDVAPGGVETVRIFRLLVPLTGRFATGGQMTFFCGFPDYSSGPYLRATGLEELIREVEAQQWQ